MFNRNENGGHKSYEIALTRNSFDKNSFDIDGVQEIEALFAFRRLRICVASRICVETLKAGFRVETLKAGFRLNSTF